jgi:hypothetical protein
MKMTTHLCGVPRLRMGRANTSTPPVCLHGIYRESGTFLLLLLLFLFLPLLLLLLLVLGPSADAPDAPQP